MVGHNAPELATQPFDQIAVIKRPGRVTVEHEQGFALPFIKIVQAVRAQLYEPGFEGVQIA